MKLTKEELERLYAEMSIQELAEHLGIARSTLYYYMSKLGVKRRSKSEAQRHYSKKHGHQRLGSEHSSETRQKIQDGAKSFWESDKGQKQKKKLAGLRKQEWQKSSKKKQRATIKRMTNADRPVPGKLSKFGRKLADYLGESEQVLEGLQLTSSHVSDIMLPERQMVIELVLPASVYGNQAQRELTDRYASIINELNDQGYSVLVVIDVSNSVSIARCKRVLEQIEALAKSKQNHLTVEL